MTTNSTRHVLSRATTLLLAGLMLLSTLLFVAGIVLERSSSGSGDTHPPVSQLAPTAVVGEAAPEGSAAREAQEGAAIHEAGEQNQVFGIDVESPWVIAGVVLLTVLLIAALFLFGYRVLPLVFIVAFVATVYDVREVVYQLGQAHYAIAFLAVGVALSRLVTIVVSGRAWRTGQRAIAPTPAR